MSNEIVLSCLVYNYRVISTPPPHALSSCGERTELRITFKQCLWSLLQKLSLQQISSAATELIDLQLAANSLACFAELHYHNCHFQFLVSAETGYYFQSYALPA